MACMNVLYSATLRLSMPVRLYNKINAEKGDLFLPYSGQ